MRVEAFLTHLRSESHPDQAARLLLLWGRTPQPASRVVITGPRAEGLRVRRLLAGY